MRYRPQKVAAGLFLFRLDSDLLLPLVLCGQHTGRGGNHQHAQDSDRITGQSKIKVKIRIGKQIIYQKNSGQRCADSIPKTIGISCYQKYKKDEKHRYIGISVVDHTQENTNSRSSTQKKQSANHIRNNRPRGLLP